MTRLHRGAGAILVVLMACAWVTAVKAQGGGFVAYPQRPAGDPAAIARGKATYGANCVFCHGAEARGGDGGGPNLLRSTLVLADKRGEGIRAVITQGQGLMPPFKLSEAEIGDLADFLHSFTVSSRTGPSTLNILVGDPRRGEAYVQQKCSACHTTAALKAVAAKIDDPQMLQQMWLMPGNAGGRGGGPAPIPAPPVSVRVTFASGEVVTGRLSRVDDFTVSLTQADGRHRTFRTVGTNTKVEILDPLTPHKELLRVYTDPDIHDVTAYLASLKGQP